MLLGRLVAPLFEAIYGIGVDLFRATALDERHVLHGSVGLDRERQDRMMRRLLRSGRVPLLATKSATRPNRNADLIVLVGRVVFPKGWHVPIDAGSPLNLDRRTVMGCW